MKTYLLDLHITETADGWDWELYRWDWKLSEGYGCWTGTEPSEAQALHAATERIRAIESEFGR